MLEGTSGERVLSAFSRAHRVEEPREKGTEAETHSACAHTHGVSHHQEVIYVRLRLRLVRVSCVAHASHVGSFASLLRR